MIEAKDVLTVKEAAALAGLAPRRFADGAGVGTLVLARSVRARRVGSLGTRFS